MHRSPEIERDTAESLNSRLFGARLWPRRESRREGRSSRNLEEITAFVRVPSLGVCFHVTSLPIALLETQFESNSIIRLLREGRHSRARNQYHTRCRNEIAFATILFLDLLDHRVSPLAGAFAVLLRLNRKPDQYIILLARQLDS